MRHRLLHAFLCNTSIVFLSNNLIPQAIVSKETLSAIFKSLPWMYYQIEIWQHRHDIERFILPLLIISKCHIWRVICLSQDLVEIWLTVEGCAGRLEYFFGFICHSISHCRSLTHYFCSVWISCPAKLGWLEIDLLSWSFVGNTRGLDLAYSVLLAVCPSSAHGKPLSILSSQRNMLEMWVGIYSRQTDKSIGMLIYWSSLSEYFWKHLITSSLRGTSVWQKIL